MSLRIAHLKRTPKKIWIPLAVILVLLVIVTLYLDVWATRYVNNVLQNRITGYQGSVDSVDVHLYRGAYQFHDLKIYKIEGKIPEPFIAIDSGDLSIQWGALFHGRIVSDAHLTKPVINFAVGKSGAKQTGKEGNWNEVIKELTPFDINIITLKDGSVHYKDFSASPPFDIQIHDVNGDLKNLRNVVDKNNPLPATIHVTGNSTGKGAMKLDGALNILTDPLDMDVKWQLEKAELKAFNSYIKDLAAIDFESGTLSIYSQLVVKKGHLTGYIKPLATHVSVLSLKHDGNPIQLVWETIAAAVIEVFTNQRKDQFATQIDLEGDINHPETDTWSVIFGIIRNAFFKAFSNSIADELHDMAK